MFSFGSAIGSGEQAGLQAIAKFACIEPREEKHCARAFTPLNTLHCEKAASAMVLDLVYTIVLHNHPLAPSTVGLLPKMVQILQ